MSYDYNSIPVIPVNETANQKNRENLDKAMKNTGGSQYTAKMSVSYAEAAREYKNGNVKGGDAKLNEGRKVAEGRLKELSKEKKEAWKNYCDYYEKSDKAYKEGKDIEAAEKYSKKADDEASKLKRIENEEKRINELKTKEEAQALSEREMVSRSKIRR